MDLLSKFYQKNFYLIILHFINQFINVVISLTIALLSVAFLNSIPIRFADKKAHPN